MLLADVDTVSEGKAWADQYTRDGLGGYDMITVESKGWYNGDYVETLEYQIGNS